MNRARVLVGAFTLLAVAGMVAAQTPSAPPEELLKAFAWYETLPGTEAGPAKYADFFVTPEVFGKARGDLADLRLRDSRDREIPYALRILAAQHRMEVRKSETFNHSRLPGDRADEISVDLGAAAIEHNEVVIETSGTNYRRPVRVEGSDRRDGDWKVLTDSANLIRFQAGGQTLSNNRVQYPMSRYRYLRVRVSPDPGIKDDTPTVQSVSVFQATNVSGEEVTLPAHLGVREFVPTDMGPGTAWVIDLGHDSVPCSRLRFEVGDEEFVRDYRLEVLGDDNDGRRNQGPGPPMKDGRYYDNYNNMSYGGVIASGQWRRRAGFPKVPMEIVFPEVRTHRLQLKITDNRNPPLTLDSVEFSAAARQVVFERSAAEGDVRVYFGNPKATDPNYDLGKNLPTTLTPAPERLKLAGNVVANPLYQPEPKPWTERWPWLIYLVLGVASVTLVGILGLLAREIARRHDATTAVHEPTPT